MPRPAVPSTPAPAALPMRRPSKWRWLRRWPFGPYAGWYLLWLWLVVALLPWASFTADTDLWVRWAQYSHAHGLGNVYALHGNNYNPLYHYILWLFGQLTGSAAAIDAHRAWLKLLTLPFDMGGAWLAASLARTERQRFVVSLLLLFNAGYLYNTLIWGQVDAIYTALVLAAVVLALREQTTWSAVCLVLALNAKLQALIFVPPLLLVWAPTWRRAPRQLAGAGLAAALVQVLVLLPFIIGGEQSYLDAILRINRQAVGYYPYRSMNAYNWWYLVTAGDPLLLPDTYRWHGLSYRHWGMLLFGAAATAVLLPLLRHALRRWRRPAPPDARLVLLSCALVPLIFCFFNTQMHERYWHGGVLLAAAYGAVSGRYWLLALVSAAYGLNLEAVMNYWQLGAWLPAPAWVAGLFAAGIGGGLAELYYRVGKDCLRSTTAVGRA